MFHEEVQKEISRRQNLEKKKKERTVIDLIGDSLPTTLPEMAAQQRVEQSNEPDFFDIASDNELPTQPMTVDTPDQVPEPIQPLEVEREKVTQIPVQIPQIPKRVKTSNAPYFVYKTFESKTDALMDVEPTSHKRALEESKAERIKKAIDERAQQLKNDLPKMLWD